MSNNQLPMHTLPRGREIVCDTPMNEAHSFMLPYAYTNEPQQRQNNADGSITCAVGRYPVEIVTFVPRQPLNSDGVTLTA